MSNLTKKAQEFANACISMNSIKELKIGLENEADKSDMTEWGISESEYFEAIEFACDELAEEKEKYRFDQGSLFEYDRDSDSYIHCFKDFRRTTKKSAIKAYEAREA